MSLLKKRQGFCPRCRRPFLPTDKFCLKCGYRLHIRRRGKFGIIKALILIAIILGVVAAVRIYQGKPIIPDMNFLNLTTNATKPK